MRLTYTDPETGIAVIMHAAPKHSLERVLGPLSEENYMAHVIGKSLPAGVKEVIVMSDDWTPPESREFRNAWKIENGQVIVDMPKARDIHRDKIRAERRRNFETLDIAAAKAMGAMIRNRSAFRKIEELTDDEAAAAKADLDARHALLEDGAERVEVAKQKLRDAPAHPAIEAADTPEALSAITLAQLIG